MFLGLTFSYAGLQKLVNPRYLDSHSPTLRAGADGLFSRSSPIGPLVALIAPHADAAGLLIAFGELAVGLGVLLGLWTRLAAVGGMVLSLSFLLTVSWHTTPYYYGSDVVFLFAWSPFVLRGSGGVLALDGVVTALAARDLRLPIRRGLATHAISPGVRHDLDRRMLVRGTVIAAALGAGGLLLGGLTAAVGRLAGGTDTSVPPLPAGSGATPPVNGSSPSVAAGPSVPAGQGTASGTAGPSGTPIAAASQIAIGHALEFRAKNGNPAWLVHETSGQFRAFSAVCTHAGCTVDFDRRGQQFSCPCHGATYDARTGEVTGGPAPSPLAPIMVRAAGGQVREG